MTTKRSVRRVLLAILTLAAIAALIAADGYLNHLEAEWEKNR